MPKNAQLERWSQWVNHTNDFIYKSYNKQHLAVCVECVIESNKPYSQQTKGTGQLR